MPSIVIREKDLTKGGGDATATDVVLVPGFMNPNFKDTEVWPDGVKDAAGANEPVLCTSVTAFERCFGSKPPLYAADAKVSDFIDSTNTVLSEYADVTIYKEGDPEKSYLYAKELLNQGIPVMYVSANGRNKTTGAVEGANTVSVIEMKQFLNSVYLQFRDKSEYDIKFVTSGGYPTLEVQSDRYVITGTLDRETDDIQLNVPASTGAADDPQDAFIEFLTGKAPLATTAIAPGEYKLVCVDANEEAPVFDYYFNNTKPKTNSTRTFSGDNASYLSVGEGNTLLAGDEILLTVQKGNGGRNTIGDPTYNWVVVTATLDGASWSEYIKDTTGQETTHSLDEFIDINGEDTLGDYASVFKVISGTTFGVVAEDGTATELSSALNAKIQLKNSKEGIPTYLGTGNTISMAVGTTTGGLAGGLVTKMVDLAAGRGDAVALIDHINIPTRPLVGQNSVYTVLKGIGSTQANVEYAAAFTPWLNIDCVTLTEGETTHSMPASLGYLLALANSNKTNANWVAIAGATRGQVPNINATKPLTVAGRLTNSIAENEYQNRNSVSINAITKINPFGYRIWGNRTLKNNSTEGNLTATSFLNVRNMISDVKKTIYRTCKKYMFEQNNDILWANFKSDIELTLNKMKTGAGISSYKIIKGTTTEKAKLVATVKLYPIYAVEDFDITVTMEDEKISMS